MRDDDEVLTMLDELKAEYFQDVFEAEQEIREVYGSEIDYNLCWVNC